ncbi:MAG: hypothetical protein OHK0024_24380 [Thalassobaculales bacterium]
MTYSLDLDMDGLTRALDLAPAILAQELARWATEGTLFVQREIVERTPRGVGAGAGLAGSIQAEPVQVLGDQVVGVVGTSLSYALPVELGSRPHFPPPQALETWVAEKFNLRGPEEIQATALAVARKIAHRGTPARHMFRDGLAAAEPELHEQAAIALDRALGRIEAEGGR